MWYMVHKYAFINKLIKNICPAVLMRSLLYSWPLPPWTCGGVRALTVECYKVTKKFSVWDGSECGPCAYNYSLKNNHLEAVLW